MTEFFCAVDLGQAADFSAAVVLEQEWRYDPADEYEEGEPVAYYGVRYIHRWPLHTAYPRIVGDLRQWLARPPLAGTGHLVVDMTGCGRPVVDQLRVVGLHPLGVTIHGGDHVTRPTWDEARVPKRDLATITALALQQRRLQISAALPEAAVLVAELQNFRVTIDPRTAHDSYAAWREQDHDDLVLALAIGLWAGESGACAPPVMFQL